MPTKIDLPRILTKSPSGAKPTYDKSAKKINEKNTLAARGLEEHVRITYPDFFENHQFHVIYCVSLAYVLFLKNF
jgi:hypothetical protein